MTIAMTHKTAAAPLVAEQLDLVQALRGLAAFGVLTHHIAVSVDKWFGAGFTPPGFGLGWVGVDLFFVLSGFIMVWTTQTAGHGLRPAAAFWTRRVLRVYPPYWAATVLAFGLVSVVPEISDHQAAGWVASLLLWPAENQPYLQPGWTLIYELWFYLGFGFLMLAPRKLLGALLFGWALAVVISALRFGMDTHPVLHVVTNPLTLNFLMGAFLALLLIQWRPKVTQTALFCVMGGSVVGLMAGAFYVTETGWSEWTRMLACGPASALLLAAAVLMDRQGLLRPPPALITLGDWSYALYLVHQPIVYAITWWSVQALGVGWAGVLIATGLGLGVPFLATAAVHVWVEKPAQNAGRALARRLKP